MGDRAREDVGGEGEGDDVGHVEHVRRVADRRREEKWLEVYRLDEQPGIGFWGQVLGCDAFRVEC